MIIARQINGSATGCQQFDLPCAIRVVGVIPPVICPFLLHLGHSIRPGTFCARSTFQFRLVMLFLRSTWQHRGRCLACFAFKPSYKSTRRPRSRLQVIINIRRQVHMPAGCLSPTLPPLIHRTEILLLWLGTFLINTSKNLPSDQQTDWIGWFKGR